MKKINKLLIKLKILQNKIIGYSCGEAHIKVDSNGIIMEAKNLESIMWHNINNDINTNVVGLHVEQFGDLLKTYACNPDNYNNFCENVSKYYLSPFLTHSIKIDDMYTNSGMFIDKNTLELIDLEEKALVKTIGSKPNKERN